MYAEQSMNPASTFASVDFTPAPPPPYNVLLLEGVHASAHTAFAGARYRLQTAPTALGAEALASRLRNVHVLGIRSKTQVTAAVLACAPNILSIGCFCIGTNQVDLAAAHARGVPVFNAPFSNTRSVAELVVAEIIALARQLCDRNQEVHRGHWRKTAQGCFEVRGKTLGIVGYGHIGSQVGVLAEALGMRVVFYDTTAKLPLGNVQDAGSLPALLAQADFVTLHVPETRQTNGMIGAIQLGQMKRGAYLLNISRGHVVDLDVLTQQLRSGALAGAAIDVYPSEPEGNGDHFSSPLQGVPNVILTPHVGGSTVEAQFNIGREVAASLNQFVTTGATTSAVNFPPVEMPGAPGLHRVVHAHHNVPGVLRDVNRIVSDCGANIHAQVLSTDSTLGYLLMDLDQDVAAAVVAALQCLPTTVHARVAA
jgi:D-3-phosphoglycerate dehydrogenase